MTIISSESRKSGVLRKVALSAQHIKKTSVTGHGESNGGWTFIASPVADDIAPSVVENLEGMKYETGTYNYDLYRFNQSADLEWENYHSHDTQENPFMLENGKGYLYASKNDRTLHFSGPFNTDHTKTVNLEYDANAEFAGWNLVGNPFPVQAWVNKSHYTMNSEGTSLVANEVASSTPIPPLTGVMMQTTSTTGENVTFSTTEPEQQSANNGSLQIALSQANTRSNALLDNAIVSFNEGSQLGKYYFGRQNANIYLPQDGEEYAIVSVGRDVARNVSIDKDVARYVSTEIPLNFKASENGTYTLSVDPQGVEMEYLHLIDNLTGADVDLTPLLRGQGGLNDTRPSTASYTFTAKTTDYASRFRLVFSEPADETSANRPFAYFADGEIRINEADARGASLQVVDVMGRVIVTKDVARNVSTNGMTPGVYVLRLIDGDNVRTQKIVVE